MLNVKKHQYKLVCRSLFYIYIYGILQHVSLSNLCNVKTIKIGPFYHKIVDP